MAKKHRPSQKKTSIPSIHSQVRDVSFREGTVSRSLGTAVCSLESYPAPHNSRGFTRMTSHFSPSINYLAQEVRSEVLLNVRLDVICIRLVGPYQS